jgi:hypothetical protein
LDRSVKLTHQSGLRSHKLLPPSGGGFRITLKYRSLAAIAVLFSFSSFGLATENEDVADDLSGPSGAIISKYLQASKVQLDALNNASMEVNIEASVPKLKEQGRLRALRMISNVGRITYRVLGFQGDNTVKSQVIGRYLEAEQQGQGDQRLNVTPANYKFRFKGAKQYAGGSDVYVFQLSPRKKRVGLFRGEIWLDASTCLPVLEKGRLVKNPSVFFKKVDFERDFAIQNGTAVPERMSSTIDTRLVGKVELNISYSNFAQNGAVGDADAAAVSVAYR